VLDEITLIKDKMDELTRGQRQIQQSLATRANKTSGLPHVHTSVLGANFEDSANLKEERGNRMMRRQTTTMTKKASQDGFRLEDGPCTPGGQLTAVNHFAMMAEKELRFVFEENTKTKDKKRELNEYVEKKCRRGSQHYAGELSSSVSNSSYLHAIVKAGHKMSAEKLELIFDSVVGLIIFANAIFVGLSMDADDSNTGAYLVTDIVFGCIFWTEMLLKLRVHGWRQRYCCGLNNQDFNNANLINMPPSRVSCGESFSNCFDLSLVIIDTAQLIVSRFPELSSVLNSGVSASLFRVVRLLRLARILRLLRAKVFRDLLTMIQGMMGGLSTLCWSIFLFVLFIYVVALVFREVLGPDKEGDEDDLTNTDSKWYFRNVPRSMFTVFRCSFGDCSTASGTPIFESVVEGSNGLFYSLIYSGFVFVVMIGLFNVISAIFVESTMASAAELAAEKQRRRLENPKRWAVNFIRLLLALMRRQWPEDDDFHEALSHGKLSDPMLERLQKEEISRELFDEVIETDGNAQQALQELDIQRADHRYLSDILDPDNSSTIGVFELIDGLQRLRGDPRRSDIIAVDLMVRSIQLKVDDIWAWTRNALTGNALQKTLTEGGSFDADSFVKQGASGSFDIDSFVCQGEQRQL